MEFPTDNSTQIISSITPIGTYDGFIKTSDLSSYSTTGNDPNYLKINGTNSMTGLLNVPNITLGSGGKINSYDDYHYIQISQPTDTLTIQEYGTISFNIGSSKTQKAKIDANGLTASSFYGNGANITDINWNNISTNKPTNFQSDWTSTIINKPSTFPADMTNIYNKTQTNDLLNAKQATLTLSTTLLGTGGSITAIDWNNITTNKPTNFQSDWTSTIINKPSTFPADLSSYSTTGNDPNYLKLTGGTMTGPITNNSTSSSTFKFLNISHSTGRISHFPHSDNKIYLRGETIIDFDTLKFGSRVADFLICLYGSDFGFGINGYTLRYNCPSNSYHRFYNGTTNTATIAPDGSITATSFSGSGASLTNLPYANITGKPTNFQADWNTTIINKPSTFPADLSLYSTTSQMNSAITTALTPYSTTGNDPNYLKLTGGTMTGNTRINGKINITNTSVNSGINFMQVGSLTIGDTALNYGNNFYNSGAWSGTNTAGLLLECANNTEIVIHDAGTRLASVVQYIGGTNEFVIGRDMGWGAISKTTINGKITLNNILDDFRIQLWDGYGFGINNSTLRYNSGSTHKFYTGTNNTFTIDSGGSIFCNGGITSGSGSHIYAGGLRIGGFDTNTLYQAGNIGITANSGSTITFNMWGGNGTIMSINNTSATINQPTTINNNLTASRYYNSGNTLNFSSIVVGSTVYYGWYLSLNNWWYSGYTYLTISASITMGGQNIYCWFGRVFLSPAGGIVSSGGVISITPDYRNPSSGGNMILVEERWDNVGNNYLRFFGTFLSSGDLKIKVYG